VFLIISDFFRLGLVFTFFQQDQLRSYGFAKKTTSLLQRPLAELYQMN